ncbi:MAG: hypothetical protein KDA28_01180, partial [Phycisphaerales bacterium]|nr:hypothetical protein [Phycisphaerales bacterium]
GSAHVADHMHAHLHAIGSASSTTERAGHVARLIRSSGLYLIVVIFMPLAVVLFALLLILACIPIAALRAPARTMQRVLSTFLGDCQALVDDPVSGAAIRTRFHRDLEDLSRRTRDVVIIAHSQGAAVTAFSLRESCPGNLREVVTLGSGLRKLASLRALPTSKEILGASIWSLGLGIGVALCVLTILMGRTDLLLFVLTGFVTAIVALGFAQPLDGTSDIRAWLRSMSGRLRWLDLHATDDPVSNGPTFDTSQASACPNYTPVEVANVGSILFDHTTYWRNDEQVLPRVVGRLAAVSGVDLGLETCDRLLHDASSRRVERVHLARVLRWSAMLGIGGVILASPDDLLHPLEDAIRHRSVVEAGAILRFELLVVAIVCWIVARLALAWTSVLQRDALFRPAPDMPRWGSWSFSLAVATGSSATCAALGVYRIVGGLLDARDAVTLSSAAITFLLFLLLPFAFVGRPTTDGAR